MIKVFKTITGDEVIGMFMALDKEAGAFSVEFPFLVNTDVDPNTKYTYTDLMPWMFGSDLQGPFKVAAHTLVVLPMDPKPTILERYQALIDKVTAQNEAAYASANSVKPLQRASNKLG